MSDKFLKEKECSICFNVCLTIPCIKKSCRFKICYDCLDQCLDIKLSEKSMPRCYQCNYYISIFNIYKNENLAQKLAKSCILELMNQSDFLKYSKIIQVEMKNNEEITMIRQNRIDFIKKSMKKSILYIAENFLKKELNEIEIEYKKKLKNAKNLSDKKCINLSCRGFLDENYKCTLCDSIFCKECEEIKKDNHKCKESIIESMKFINNMIKCPNCKIPIEKSSGCNYMRCVNCKTNFMYDTGAEGGSGNMHNTDLETDHFDKPYLFIEYEKKLLENKIYEEFKKFEESFESKKIEKKIYGLMKLISNSKEEEIEKMKIKICTTFCNIVKLQIKEKEYYKLLTLFEDKLKENMINPSFFNREIRNYYIFYN